MYPGKGTVVLIRPAQTFYETIMYKMALLVPMLAVTILLGCVPGSAPTPHSAAHLRHLEDKQYMLQVINAERTNSGLTAVLMRGST